MKIPIPVHCVYHWFLKAPLIDAYLVNWKCTAHSKKNFGQWPILFYTYVHKIIVVFSSIIKPKSKSLHRSFGELFQEHLENPELIEKTQENKPGENWYEIESRLKIAKNPESFNILSWKTRKRVTFWHLYLRILFPFLIFDGKLHPKNKWFRGC